MERKPTIQSKTKFFSSLLREGRYTVPWHQRSYDWSKEHVKELLRDIKEAMIKRDTSYFLGSIMLIEDEEQEKTWEINDGQQRIVTFSLICGYLCRIFHAQNQPTDEKYALRLLFDIQEFDNYTLINADKLSPRLTPPKNDERQYHPMIKNKNIGRNGKLTDAWNVIETFFSGMNINETKAFFNFLINKVEISCLYIPQSIDYNFVFEIINNRGKKLEDFDLIRNYMYSFFNSSGKPEQETVHNNIEKIKIFLKGKAPDYVRCFFQCEYGYLPKENFYRKVKKEILESKEKSKTDNYVYSLIERLTDIENMTIYKIISSKNIQEQENILQEFMMLSGTRRYNRNLPVLLREMQKYSISLPIIFAYMRCFMNILQEKDKPTKKRAAKFIACQLHNLCSFIMRTAFVAPKFESSHYDTSFANIAKTISETDNSYRDVNIYENLSNSNDDYGILDDKIFKDLIKRPIEMKDRNKIKQFLYSIINDGSFFNIDKCTVEHILPNSTQWLPGWKNFDDETHGKYANVLGNFTLLREREQKSGEKHNKSFNAKKGIFNKSNIKITQDICDFDDWSPESIEQHQNTLAKMAVKTWDFKIK